MTKAHVMNYTDPAKRYTLHPIYGDCLEGAPVHLRMPNNAYAIIDRSVTPKVGDVVFCTKVAGGMPGYIKRIENIEDGVYTVGTCYNDAARNFSFEAAEILGVIIQVYDRANGLRIWSVGEVKA